MCVESETLFSVSDVCGSELVINLIFHYLLGVDQAHSIFLPT